jgi:hypothetical protein
MRFSLPVALLAFLLPLVTHCQAPEIETVFISKTCRDMKEWKTYWSDFQLISELAAKRMGSETDTDYHAVSLTTETRLG